MPRVFVLRCQACRAELPATSNDVAFRCPQCGRAWEIADGALRERPSFHVAPPAAARGAILYLPYWSFPVSASAEPRTRDEKTLTARDRAAKFERAWVAAYSIHRPTYVGEWGLVYTRVPPGWEARTGHGPEAAGATIASSDAKKIVTHYILMEIDRMADISTLDINMNVGDPELWAIPCLDLGEQLRCPWTRGELPVSALDDFSEIQRRKERLEA
ncbi:MAG TPA: hypothetical protein VLC48_05955 [Gemmatimonadota bacterium]|nr:hypothetical protein [Gemmatimonadota bacterium]